MLTINQTLNNTYKITEELGSGGGGVVYKAYHLRLEKYVAIKLIKDSVKGAINERAEADILKRLKHEGLPQVYDFINDGEDVYTVMEYIDVGSLFDEIVKQKKIPYKQALQWSKELCSAAAYLHTRKPPIIHSDIKPRNIMITSEGKLCLIDFNISSVFGNGIYTVGSSGGYSPPEQYIARAERAKSKSSPSAAQNCDTTELMIDEDTDKTEILADNDKTEILSDIQNAPNRSENTHISDSTIIDARSDVYSIGAVMYSMLTGMKPQNSQKNITPIKELDENIPEALVFIIERAMSKEKEKRFSSAEEMLRALNNIVKLDRRYKRMALRQQLAFIFCLLLTAGSAVSIIAGYRLMQTEKEDKYSGYILSLSDMCASGELSEFDDIFGRVTAEYPGKTEPYYYKAMALYAEKDYSAAEEYIRTKLDASVSELTEQQQSNTYFMLADILFRQENYGEAAVYYEKAAEYAEVSTDLYRDYAISLARNSDTAKAEAVLQTAIAHGLTDDGIYMVTGEIQFMRKEYSDAVSSLKKVTELTDDDILRRNAYLLCSRAYKEQYGIGQKTIILENISILERSLIDLPDEMTMQLREYLAQAYIDYGEISGQTEYYAKAVTLLNDMRTLGWSNYQTEMNIAVLCDRIGDTRTCKMLLNEMTLVPEYEPYYFTIYVRLAYCEASIQDEKEISERDYSEFDKFYRCAEKAYKSYSENGNSDPEMDKLSQLRAEMVSLGWLE